MRTSRDALRLWRAGVLVALGGALAVAACTASPDPVDLVPAGPTATPEPASVAAGRAIFEERCASCHGIEGDRIPAAPLDARAYLDQIGDARLVAAGTAGDTSRHPLAEGDQRPVTLQGARDAAAYLAARTGRITSPLLRYEGERRYESSCVGCHGIAGDRIPAAPLDSTAFVATLSDADLHLAITEDHGGAMGPSNASPVDDIEAALIAAFVRQRTLPGNNDPTIAAGRDLYAGNCLACHGTAGDAIESIQLGSSAAAMSVGRIVDIFADAPSPPHRVGTLDFGQVSDLVEYLTWWAADTDRHSGSAEDTAPAKSSTKPPFRVSLTAPIFPDRVVAKEYYLRACAVCHGADRGGIVGPPLLPETLTGSEEEYARAIAEGRQSLRMPSFAGRLDDDQIATLVAFITSDPPSPGDTATLLYGRELFENTCALCHAVDGLGVAACPLGNREWIDNMSREGLVTRISRGKPSQGMPTWAQKYGGALTDEQIASVADYLRSRNQ